MFAHTDQLFKAISILKIEGIFTINKIKLYFKYIKGILPFYFQSLMFQENVHRYGTRNCDLRKIRVRHDFTKNCVQYSIASTMNNCPPNIKCKLYTHSLPGLILYCKRFFIDSYVVECHIPRCYVCLILEIIIVLYVRV